MTLGQPGRNPQWPDYLSLYGFSAADIPELITLLTDETFNELDSSHLELWAPLYAWRILGQLASTEAIAPMVSGFDSLLEDDYAFDDSPIAIGMIGPAAIPALWAYWQQPGKDQFSYVMALDSLYEIATRHPASRAQVLECYQRYMAKPITSAFNLNGLLISRLIDMGASELIEDIRHLFALDCVDISCAGDLEEVEMWLGLPSERSTPKRTTAESVDIDRAVDSILADIEEDEYADEDGIFYIIDSCIEQYGSDHSILDSSELDGFFAAIACSPDLIKPSSWMPALWGGEEHSPEWESIEQATLFNQALFEHYNMVVDQLQYDLYDPLYLEATINDTDLMIVDEWCEGFLRGLTLWPAVPSADMKHLEKCLHPIRYFCTAEGFDALETFSNKEIRHLQKSIAPKVSALYRHFFKPVTKAPTTVVHSNPKVGRNDPCSCGSGKKYKKCCGLN